MRYVAQYPVFNVQIRPERTRLTSDGEVIVRQEGIIADFKSRGWNQRDMEVALISFQFKGLVQYEDEATSPEPAYRLSYFDTDEEGDEWGWDQETRELVDRRMMEAKSYGRAFVLVPEVALEAPWPLYDSFEGDATELVLTIHQVIGIPFEQVLEYEASKWGPQREEVIEALNEAIRVRDEGKVVVQ
jgi:hypothetical protein